MKCANAGENPRSQHQPCKCKRGSGKSHQARANARKDPRTQHQVCRWEKTSWILASSMCASAKEDPRTQHQVHGQVRDPIGCSIKHAGKETSQNVASSARARAVGRLTFYLPLLFASSPLFRSSFPSFCFISFIPFGTSSFCFTCVNLCVTFFCCLNFTCIRFVYIHLPFTSTLQIRFLYLYGSFQLLHSVPNFLPFIEKLPFLLVLLSFVFHFMRNCL